MSKLKIRTSEAFEPLLHPSRYKGAWGGRGSGKSHFFAELGLEDALRFPGDYGEGLRWACIREVQKSLKDSAKFLIEKKLSDFGLGASEGFKVFASVIELPGDGVVTFDGMQDHTADSFKSKEGFHRLWGEEAQAISDTSMTIMRPTIRAEGSELWFSWNPRRPTDPVDKLLRGANLPTGATVVKANWSDNFRFPLVLEQERQDDLKNRPEQYGHIWEGEYARVFEGAYYASHLERAEQEGRIGNVGVDDLIEIRAYWDIGGTSGKSDATAVWISQFIGGELRVLDYYEAVGQPFSEHVHWLKSNGWGRATCKLPHDGRKHDIVHKVTPQSFLQDAGFDVEVLPNIGNGAGIKRVEATRRVLPSCRFNRDKTEGGRDALGWYHEKKDEVRGIGLGPDHDWSSHAADAFGGMCIDFLDRADEVSWGKPLRRNLKGIA